MHVTLKLLPQVHGASCN